MLRHFEQRVWNFCHDNIRSMAAKMKIEPSCTSHNPPTTAQGENKTAKAPKIVRKT